MTNGKRDYKKEERLYEKKHPNRDGDRVARNKARKEAGLKVGDPRQADHKKPLTEGGSKKKSNVRIVSKTENLTKEANRKKREAKK
ncbi:hypothetical protein [Caudoviricetes sp.]|nr:hypothetical protein [Caudoviricetes sp.]